jgi:DNA-binding PadR family transcriptional regulator
MRLKPGSYLILGMLDSGVSTGYAIKRAVDRSTRFFWAASLAQVYHELAALEKGAMSPAPTRRTASDRAGSTA